MTGYYLILGGVNARELVGFTRLKSKFQHYSKSISEMECLGKKLPKNASIMEFMMCQVILPWSINGSL